jgi:hypothetical protein
LGDVDLKRGGSLTFGSSKYAMQLTKEHHAFLLETFSRQNELAVTHKIVYIVM